MSEPWQMIAEFELSSQPGAERQAMDLVADLLSGIFSGEALDRVKTAVSEGALNAIEHGNLYHPEEMVNIKIGMSEKAVLVRITDQGGGRPIPEYIPPNIEAKLAGIETPRGWGMFLIRHMVDEMHISSDDIHHILELIFYREKRDDGQTGA